MLNICIFEGRLGAKPELKFAAGSGNPFATAGLAVNESRKVDGTWETDTTWVDLVFFGKKAESVAKVLDKGDLISIEGKYQKRKYQNDAGENRYSHSFVVQSWNRLAQQNTGGGTGDSGDYESDGGGEIPF